VEVLWPMDHAVEGGEGQPGPFRSGRQLWCPLLDRGRKQRQKAGFLVCVTKPRRRTAVEDDKS